MGLAAGLILSLAATRNSALCYNGNHLAADTDTAAPDQAGLAGCRMQCSSQAVNDGSRSFQSAHVKVFKEPFEHSVLIFVIVKALVGGDCETSRRLVDSCSVRCVPRPSDVT